MGGAEGHGTALGMVAEPVAPTLGDPHLRYVTFSELEDNLDAKLGSIETRIRENLDAAIVVQKDLQLKMDAFGLELTNLHSDIDALTSKMQMEINVLKTHQISLGANTDIFKNDTQQHVDKITESFRRLNKSVNNINKKSQDHIPTAVGNVVEDAQLGDGACVGGHDWRLATAFGATGLHGNPTVMAPCLPTPAVPISLTAHLSEDAPLWKEQPKPAMAPAAHAPLQSPAPGQPDQLSKTTIQQGQIHRPPRDPEHDAWHSSPDPWSLSLCLQLVVALQAQMVVLQAQEEQQEEMDLLAVDLPAQGAQEEEVETVGAQEQAWRRHWETRTAAPIPSTVLVDQHHP